MENAFAVWLAVAVVMACLSGIGRLVAGRDPLPFTPLWLGWGVVTVMFTLLVGLEPPVQLDWLVALFGVAGMLGLLVNGPRRDDVTQVAMLTLLALPLIMVWSHNSVFMWDDFAHRLPSLEYLYQHNSLPRSGLPASHSDFPAYPYTLTFLGFAVCALLGTYEPLAIAALNGALLVSLGGMVAATLWPRGHGWARPALGLLLVSALAPPFMPKLVASAYQDAALGWAVAATWLVWRQAGIHPHSPWRHLLQLGVLLALVTGLKQVGFVLALLLAGGFVLAHIATTAPRRVGELRLLLLLLAPMFLAWGAWRSYVAQHLAGGEFALMPLADWNWPLVPAMALHLLGELWEKPLVYLPLPVLTLLAFLPRSRPYAGAPLWVALGVAWGYTGFLLLMYLAAFGAYEAGILASFSRYLQHVNWLVWLALLGLAQQAGWFERLHHRALTVLMVAALMVLPFALNRQLIGRPNAEAQGMQRVAALLRPTLDATSGTVVQVDEPTGSGFRAKVLKYELGGRATVRTGATRFGVPTHPTAAGITVIADDDGILIHDCRTLPCRVREVAP